MTDKQTDLRDRIAAAIWAQYSDAEPSQTGLVMANPHAVADAVLAVLPPPADRAAVLLRAADFAEEVAEKLRAHHEFERSSGALDVMTELRRMAVEAQQQSDTETWDVPDARPGTTDHTLTKPVRHAPGTAVLCPDCRAKGHSVCCAAKQQPAAADTGEEAEA